MMQKALFSLESLGNGQKFKDKDMGADRAENKWGASWDTDRVLNELAVFR